MRRGFAIKLNLEKTLNRLPAYGAFVGLEPYKLSTLHAQALQKSRRHNFSGCGRAEDIIFHWFLGKK
jgi:hypothetical protein